MSELGNRYQIGIDIGGTFTDFVIFDVDAGQVTLEKSLSTPEDLWQGIEVGLRRAGTPLSNAVIAHGTTIGLNTMLERRGSPTGLITTIGFRDTYEIGRGARPEMYNLFFRKPVPLVPRELRLEVRERLDAQGDVVIELDEGDVANALAHFRNNSISEIAVCFLHAYVNPVHERRVAELAAQLYPEARLSLSHELVREWREYERTSTTCVNAYIRPRTGEYMTRAEAQLASAGYRAKFFINQSSGGTVSAQTASNRPVTTLFSGPAGGIAAAARIGQLSGFPNVIAFDMGGTSTDVAVIQDGRIRLTSESKVDRHPIAVPAVDLQTIGAGGGSIAKLDEVGSLTVGPASAGANPGPACYRRGGEAATVTDADLVLGRLAPSEYVPDELELDVDAAATAIGHAVAGPLGLDVNEAAAGIIEIINLKMAMAVRAVTVQRGLDPKDFALYAYGGAGPCHACWIARELTVPVVVVPVAPGQFSALGIAMTDVRHDLIRTTLIRASDLNPTRVNEIFNEIEDDARVALALEGILDNAIRLRRSADVRYSGQEYTINVPIEYDLTSPADLEQLADRFHHLHELTYNHSSRDETIELVNFRVEATGAVRVLEPTALPIGGTQPPPDAQLPSTRTVFDRGSAAVETTVWDRPQLRAGNRIDGPTIIAEVGATTVVPPGATCTVDSIGQLIIQLSTATDPTVT